jgi:hypothetical protein
MQIGPFPPADIRRGDPINAAWLNQVKGLAGMGMGILPIEGFVGGAGAVLAQPVQSKPVGFINQSGEDIPPGSILRVTGFSRRIGGQTIVTVDKPNTYGSQDLHFISNWCVANVIDGGYGTCQPIAYPMLVAYKASDGDPEIGEFWGPRNDEWVARKNTGGFRVVDLYEIQTGDTPLKYAVVIQSPMDSFYGKNTGAQIAKGSTGIINIYTGDFGSEVDSGLTMPDVLARFGAIATNAMVQCKVDKQSGGDAPNWYGLEQDLCPV